MYLTDLWLVVEDGSPESVELGLEAVFEFFLQLEVFQVVEVLAGSVLEITEQKVIVVFFILLFVFILAGSSVFGGVQKSEFDVPNLFLRRLYLLNILVQDQLVGRLVALALYLFV